MEKPQRAPRRENSKRRRACHIDAVIAAGKNRRFFAGFAFVPGA